MLRDPLVPLDFGGWFERVFGAYSLLFDAAATPVTYLAGLIGLPSAGAVIGIIVDAALLIPVAVFAVAVFLVTYAELRHREDRSITTRELAAELSRDRVRH